MSSNATTVTTQPKAEAMNMKTMTPQADVESQQGCSHGHKHGASRLRGGGAGKLRAAKLVWK
ncbi:hypothetical protein H0H92_016021 [Tricholoma furcatifolium]|nr:hypothetical protein H0H92_016021 [Tricholoma furcatifolium]